MTFSELQHKIQNSPYLDFGNILDDSIKMFKEVWLKGFLMILILAILAIGLTMVFTAIGLGPDPYAVNWIEDFSFYSSMTANSIYNLPQSILLATFSLGMLAGFYKICKQTDLNDPVRDDFFYFFKGPYLSKVFMLGIIYTVIATVAQIMFFIPYIYAFIPLSFFAVIFSNNPDLSEMEIVKLSFNLGTKKWFVTFGLLFVTGILGMLGIIACGIGVLFTISIMYLPIYFIYRDVIGFSEDDEIMKIGTE